MTEVEEIELEDRARVQLWKERISELARVAEDDELPYKDKVKSYTKSKKYLLSLQALNKRIANRKPASFFLTKELKGLIGKVEELNRKLKP